MFGSVTEGRQTSPRTALDKSKLVAFEQQQDRKGASGSAQSVSALDGSGPSEVQREPTSRAEAMSAGTRLAGNVSIAPSIEGLRRPIPGRAAAASRCGRAR